MSEILHSVVSLKLTDVSPHHRDDEGSKHFWNVGQLLRDYTTPYPRRLSSSYSLSWAPEISQDG
jgi:hypothetical protein